MEQLLKSYFQKQQPFGNTKVFDVTLLTDGNSNNHQNYLVETLGGKYVARITKSNDISGYTNLADEFTILKLVEEYHVGPRVFFIDLENFDTPLLCEEYFEGVSLAEITNPDELMLHSVLELLLTTSKISLGHEKFPFKFSYTTYETNIQTWWSRLEEVAQVLGKGHLLISEFTSILKQAEEVLRQGDSILKTTRSEFIYNDVHPGNVFWLPEERKASFIDWQKVSIGDPTFMVALFARRFGEIWNQSATEFTKKVISEYSKKKNIPNFEELFYARMLERAVSDMGWSVWAEIKREGSVAIKRLEENKFYPEVKERLSSVPRN